jgi:site-specific recombinase XerD
MVARPRRIVTIADAAADFLVARELEGRSPRTVALYKGILADLAAFAGDAAPAELDAPTLRRWLAGLAARGLTGTSQNGYLRVARNFLRWCDLEGGYGVDATALTRVKSPRLDTAEVEPFTPAEIARLYAACQPGAWLGLRQRAVLSVLLDAGLRAGELCGLRLGDADLRAGLLTVRAATSKARRGRAVQLGRRAQRDLAKWLDYRVEHWSAPTDGPVFVGRYGPGLTPRTLERLTERLGRRAGVPDCHPHRFRHSFAFMCLEAGLGEFAVQVLLGHTDLAMTRKYVSRLAQNVSEAKRARSPLDRLRL